MRNRASKARIVAPSSAAAAGLACGRSVHTSRPTAVTSGCLSHDNEVRAEPPYRPWIAGNNKGAEHTRMTFDINQFGERRSLLLGIRMYVRKYNVSDGDALDT